MQTVDIYGKTLSDNFNTATSAYAQKVKPRIIIDLLDGRHVDNLTVTTNDPHSNTSQSSFGYYFDPKQAMNGIERQSYTWAVAGAKDNYGKVIKADGTWHAMPSNTDPGYEFGWISATKSLSNTHATYTTEYGFTVDPYIQFDFTQRKVNRIRVITSEFSGQIGHYTIQAYNQTYSAILNETSYIANGEYYRDHWLSSDLPSQDIYRIKITIHTTKNPQDYVRLQEVCPIYEYDISDYVTDTSIDRVRDLHETSLPIGGSGSSKVSFNLDNTEKVFNIFSSSTFGQYLKKDLKVHISLGWRIKKTDDLLSNTVLKANMNSSSAQIIVDDTNIFPVGGGNNKFTIFIDKDKQSKEIILIDSVIDDKTLQVSSRGYAGTIANSHTNGATVTFDPYEYVDLGTFYVDEWSASSQSMTVSGDALDWSKYLNEKTINNGFLIQNSTVGKAVEVLMMESNFPKKDYKYLRRYTEGARERGAILHMPFNEPSIDRSGNNIVPSSGLRARFWAMPENNLYGVKDIVADAIDKQLSPLDIAEGLKPFVSPTYVTLSKDISSSNTYALDLSNYSFIVNGSTYTDYYNGVFDGYYIPLDSGSQDIVVYIKYGGVRVYLDDTIIIDEWLNHETTGGATKRVSSYSYLGYHLDLDDGVPYKIRIEFYHGYGSSGNQMFSIELAKSVAGDPDETILASECATVVPVDFIGSRNASFTYGDKNMNHHRNYGIYRGSVLLNQTSGINSEKDNFSVKLQSNSYIRIPNHISWNLANTSSNNYTGEFTIELYAKFENGSFSNTGEYLSCWASPSASNGFEFYSNSSSNGIKIVTNSGTATASSNVSLSTTSFTHIAATYKNNQINYYINGDLKSTANVASMPSWASDICIGGRGASFTDGTGESAPLVLRSFTIDEFAIYNKCLSAEDIKDRYVESQIQPITVFPFLYGNDETIKNIIDEITFADFGRLFIDEKNMARYEHFYRFYESSIDQHANIQANINSDSHIISADYAVQLQTNKIVIKVAGIASAKSGTQSLWRAEDPTTLTVASLTQSITSNSSSMYVNSTEEPPFATSGYLKIDDEIIKYNAKDSNKFLNLERGQFGTTAASHSINSNIKEARHYDLKYDKAPAYNVKSPFITGILFEDPDQIEIHKFHSSAYGAELIIVASDNVDVGEIVFAEGTNPLTNKVAFTSIAGIPIITTEEKSQVKEQVAALSESIRKYGLKDVVIESRYITDNDHAKKLADFMISKLSEPVPILNVQTLAMPKLQLGDRIRITQMNSFDIINNEYWVVSHSLNFGESMSHTLTLRKVS